MANEIWQQEEQKFLQAIQGVKIPDENLSDVAFITPRNAEDFVTIPQKGGCYWIWTNEPVIHFLHKNSTPPRFDDGEIIYNGIAQDDIRGRIEHHLLGDVDAGWSGISLDIYFGNTVSHRKKAFSENGKVPYIKTKKIMKRANKKKGILKGDEIEIFKSIRTKVDFKQINLSEYEKQALDSLNNDKIYFRNGINITDEKHRNYNFRVYYIAGLSSLYLEFIEKKWRENNGLPRLCSYSTGR